MRITYLTVLLTTTWFCGACWRSHWVGEAGAGGVAATAGDADGSARAGSGAGGQPPARAGNSGSAGSQRAYCGDGVVTYPEQCDGSDLNGETCSTLGEGAGQLLCQRSICQFDVSMCGSEPVDPAGPAYPDGTYYAAPETPERCMELSAFLLRTYFSYTVADDAWSCACDNCLDTYGPCLTDYDCTNIVACCIASGKPDQGCMTDPECGSLIVEWFPLDPSNMELLTSLSSCFLSACMGLPPTP